MNPTRNQSCPCGSGLKYKRCCGKISDEPRSPSRSMSSMDHPEDLTITIHGNILVVVPDSLDLITSYVLREQEDWFEDEIKFVRELVQPGMNTIDVGANYGLYTLSMACKTGAEGHVWAFEPASATASFLQRSLELNKFSNTTVIQCALSNKTGTAKLGLNQNSELNTLCHDNSNAFQTESVALTTLDRYTTEHRCEQIEFVKLDAEGEEGNIIRGGAAFFTKESPLIMYELKHRQQINLALIRQFDALGYRPYRLIPGLNILAPFELAEPPDPYQLNLFCCKNDRARQLEERGMLATSLVDMDVPGESSDLIWRHLLESKPYARNMLKHWDMYAAGQPAPGWKKLRKAVELYSIAHDHDRSPGWRYTALKSSYGQLAVLCNGSPSVGRLCTLARVARELGYRTEALRNVTQALDMCARQRSVGLEEPFLPVSPCFDNIDPEDRIEAWIICSLRTEGETLQSFSSYYTGKASLQNLEMLLNTGFAGPEMERRRQLIRMRYGLQAGPGPSPLLEMKKIDNLNPDLWKSVSDGRRSAESKSAR